MPSIAQRRPIAGNIRIGAACVIEDGKPVFKPLNEYQDRFIRSRAMETVYNADLGGGKTDGGCEAVHDDCINYAGVTNLVLRKTAVSCHRTTMEIYRQDILGPDLWDAWFLKAEFKLVYPNGSQVIFAGLDDPSAWQSGAFGTAFIDELVQHEAGGSGVSEKEWESVGDRLRDTHMPHHRLMGACNAGHEKHWILRRAREGRLTLIKAPPGLNTKLPADYILRKSQMTGVHYRRYVLNEWVSPEGVVFDEFDARIHVRDDIDPIRGVPLKLGVDFGYNHPFSAVIGWRVIYGESELQWRIVDQCHGGRDSGVARTIDEWGREINAKFPENPLATAYCDHSPNDQHSLRRHASRIGTVLNAVKKDELGSINLLKALLRKRINGKEPGIVIHSRCTALISELESLTWAVTRGGDVLERPEDKGNDSIDSLRYLVMSDAAPNLLGPSVERPFSTPDEMVSGMASVASYQPGRFDESEDELDAYSPGAYSRAS